MPQCVGFGLGSGFGFECAIPNLLRRYARVERRVAQKVGAHAGDLVVEGVERRDQVVLEVGLGLLQPHAHVGEQLAVALPLRLEARQLRELALLDRHLELLEQPVLRLERLEARLGLLEGGLLRLGVGLGLGLGLGVRVRVGVGVRVRVRDRVRGGLLRLEQVDVLTQTLNLTLTLTLTSSKWMCSASWSRLAGRLLYTWSSGRVGVGQG